jgi:hypothetical protein
MGKTKHEKTYVDFEHPYEQNIIGMRGIIYFGVGLFLLIVITFGLMWFLQDVMEEQAIANDERNRNPMMMNDRERLPPEPRLQAAPGFGVDVSGGRVNLELNRPQAEWEVLQQQYKEIWEKGQTAPNGTAVTLPIDEAKKRFLAGQTTGAQNQNILDESRSIYSDSSSGRVLNEKRR